MQGDLGEIRGDAGEPHEGLAKLCALYLPYISPRSPLDLP